MLHCGAGGLQYMISEVFNQVRVTCLLGSKLCRRHACFYYLYWRKNETSLTDRGHVKFSTRFAYSGGSCGNNTVYVFFNGPSNSALDVFIGILDGTHVWVPAGLISMTQWWILHQHGETTYDCIGVVSFSLSFHSGETNYYCIGVVPFPFSSHSCLLFEQSGY